MKPTRGLPNTWLGNLPRERRTALLSVALLLMLLGAMLIYQQFQAKGETTPQSPPPTEVPPARAEDPSTPPAGAAEPGEAGAAEAASQQPSDQASAPDRLSHPLGGVPDIIKAYHSLDEAYGDYRLYTATAYAAAPGQSVRAPASGTVVGVEEDLAEGLTLVLDHGGGLTTRLSGLWKVLVSEGDRVEEGAVVAQIGQPGFARSEMGPHLAFQVRLDGAPVDPASYLKGP